MNNFSDCIDSGDTTWVLVSTILVLGMMPALAFFEAGLLRSKNTSSLISQIIGGLVVLGFIWDVIGYSLVFGPTLGGFIGNLDHFLLLGVDYDSCSNNRTIPDAAFALFMMMFAVITPLLITGAIAERVKWKSFFILMISWEILIFYPIAQWMWGGGWLQKLGALDFAGGIVIHTSAGTGSFVLAKLLGKRKGFDSCQGEFPPSNLPMAALGAALLWMGWFGFNAGSALQAGSLATSAVASTQIAACSSGMVWLILSWIKNKPSSVALINGVVAGLAGITPASGYINSQWTILVGLIVGLASYFSAIFVKRNLKIDDALDVSSVHGVTGIIGSLSIGFFSQHDINLQVNNGVVFGDHSFKLLGIQLLAVLVTMVYSGVVTFIIGMVIQKTIGLRITEDEEDQGLDYVEHRENAYLLKETEVYEPINQSDKTV